MSLIHRHVLSFLNRGLLDPPSSIGSYQYWLECFIDCVVNSSKSGEANSSFTRF
ncbi:hypothetical protein BDV93DRAFT_529451 [Ceratobasidium sp. AG-I]|nr:hypothetical protein BDV93DRAFT_529451 [Ceratobasidium sp. AG-I]